MQKQETLPEVKKAAPLTSEQLNEWGAPVISPSDVIVPKILPMQLSSVMVAEDKARVGEFRDSLSGALIGSIDKPFECIPFYLDKCWDVLLEQADGQFKWDRTIPVVENPQSVDFNDDWKWEGEEGGIKTKNVRRFNFYVLLPSEVASGTSIPYVFSFKSTSMKEGKKLFTQLYMRNIRGGLPPAAFHIHIGGQKVKNDKGIFVVPNFILGSRSTEAELADCLSWIKLIRKGAVKIDEKDVQDAPVDVAASDTGEF